MAVHDEAPVRARPRNRSASASTARVLSARSGTWSSRIIESRPARYPRVVRGSVLSLACGGDEEIPLEIATTRSAREAYCLSQSSHPSGGSCA